MKMGPICCPETSVTGYQIMPRNVAEERRPGENCVEVVTVYFKCKVFILNKFVKCDYCCTVPACFIMGSKLI